MSFVSGCGGMADASDSKHRMGSSPIIRILEKEWEILIFTLFW